MSKILVIRGKDRMWHGRCTCGVTWQFWFWGATLGYGFQHLWKHQYS